MVDGTPNATVRAAGARMQHGADEARPGGDLPRAARQDQEHGECVADDGEETAFRSDVASVDFRCAAECWEGERCAGNF